MPDSKRRRPQAGVFASPADEEFLATSAYGQGCATFSLDCISIRHHALIFTATEIGPQADA